MIEIFETYSGRIGVRYQLGFNQAGIEVFECPDEAWKFVQDELGADMELCYYDEEGANGWD